MLARQALTLLLLSYGCHAKRVPFRNPFRSPEDEDRARNYTARLSADLGPQLSLPPILQPNTSPKKFMEEQNIGKSGDLCGIC